MSEPRPCTRAGCPDPIVRRAQESAARFAARKFCSCRCSDLHARERRQVRVARIVALLAAGVPVAEVARREGVTVQRVERLVKNGDDPVVVGRRCRECAKPMSPGRQNRGLCAECRQARDRERRERRHQEIIDLRRQGLEDPEIADRLKISRSRLCHIVNVEMAEGKAAHRRIADDVPARIRALRAQLPACEVELMRRLQGAGR